MALYLIPNLIAPDTVQQAIPPHNLQEIKKITHFLVEDIRTARRFISSLNLGINIRELHFEVLNKKTKIGEIKGLLQKMKQGLNIGVLSESGCPGIADPGNIAVQWAHREEIRVIPLVGPSSIFLALMASGMNGQNFAFQGYLPVKDPQRRQAIQASENESRRLRQTQIFIETPYRNQSLFQAFLANGQANTQLCIAQNLSAEQEWILNKSIREWKKKKVLLEKVPTIFLLESF